VPLYHYRLVVPGIRYPGSARLAHYLLPDHYRTEPDNGHGLLCTLHPDWQPQLSVLIMRLRLIRDYGSTPGWFDTIQQTLLKNESETILTFLLPEDLTTMEIEDLSTQILLLTRRMERPPGDFRLVTMLKSIDYDKLSNLLVVNVNSAYLKLLHSPSPRQHNLFPEP
jgi:hypothetical protein